MAKSAEQFVRDWARANITTTTVRDARGELRGVEEFMWPCIQAAVEAGFDEVESEVDVPDALDQAIEAAATGDDFF